jgi:hypothetical protein
MTSRTIAERSFGFVEKYIGHKIYIPFFQQILFETLLDGPGFESREEQEILSSAKDI